MKAEHRALLAEGDDRLERTRYLWLMGEDKLARLSRERRSQFDELATSTLKVARAWAIKETARGPWGYVPRLRLRGWGTQRRGSCRRSTQAM